MATRAELRQKIRDELNDNAAAKLWTDALLNDFIVQAIRGPEAKPRKRRRRPPAL